MPQITYKDNSVIIDEPESVLEGLEKAGFEIPFSCRAGICHSCMMQAEQQPPITSQQGLSENQKAQHFFLACSCIPKTDMSVSLIGDTSITQATVIEKKKVNDSVLALFIQVDFRWYPGQYLTVWRDDIQGRSYSIASLCEQDKIIELHVKRHDQGLVSRWLHDELVVGQSISVSKPMGNCFYSDDHHSKPILMASTGTGLAPLLGVLREALAQQHTAPIYLYTAAGEPSDLYYRDELQQLSDQHENVHYIPSVRREAGDDATLIQEDVVDLVKQRHDDLKGWKVFLCGSENMIKQLQRHSFFQGATVSDILVDAFIIDKPTI
ncbi:MAG: 2Fe-2S iron-sulfur cluster-binding protein [Cellvibrionaceae bacterium]